MKLAYYNSGEQQSEEPSKPDRHTANATYLSSKNILQKTIINSAVNSTTK